MAQKNPLQGPPDPSAKADSKLDAGSAVPEGTWNGPGKNTPTPASDVKDTPVNDKPTVAPTISTEGLSDGKTYTYKNGKLTEYTPPAATPAATNYGLDPLSMATIMSQSIDPELASLNKQFSTTTNANDKLLSGQLANDQSLGIPASALALIKSGNSDVTAANQAALIGNEKAGIAGAPIDALITALGQSADAARLAGYEAEYGQAANGSGSSANSTASSVANLIASLGSQPSA